MLINSRFRTEAGIKISMRWTGLFFIFLAWLSTWGGLAAAGPYRVLDKITVSDGIVEVFVTGRGKVKTDSFILTSPERIVLDLEGVQAGSPGQIPGQGRIKKVRYSQFSPTVTRVVLDLDKENGYKLDEEQTSRGRIVRVRLASLVTGIRLLATEPLPTLKLEGSGRLAATTFTLRSPERFVVDIASATLAEGVTLPEGIGLVAGVRASQFKEDTVRVVLDLAQPLYGMIEELPEGIQLPLRHKLQKLFWQDGQLQINTMGPKPQSITRKDGKIWLEFPYTVGTDLKMPKGPKGFTLHLSQKESWFLGIECPGKRAKLAPSSAGLTVQFFPSALWGVSVLLDPGHGGADPGAIGPTGLREKDVNLAIAKHTAAFLEEYGARVQLTRTDDSYLSLPQRVAQSNGSGVRIFISIHCNSFGDSSKQGVETYYSANSLESKALAQSVQEQLVCLRPCIDRKAKEGNLYVLRENLATAILTEVAFISNPEEETLLCDPDYQQKVGRAIADGIEAFLEENQQ